MIARTIKQSKLILLPTVFLLTPVCVYGQDLCQPSGYVVGYFNGVWTTQHDAELDRDSLQPLLFGNTFNNEIVKPELFYNHTGIKLGGINIPGTLIDLGETFEQRSSELDGAIFNRWEIFWEIISSPPDDPSFLGSITTKIINASAQLKILQDTIVADIIAKTIGGLTSLLTLPQTAIDYTKHDVRIKTFVTERKKLLLFAHSQGNLFANHAYDVALTLTTGDSVKLVHIAPASAVLRGCDNPADRNRGCYELADNDLVITRFLRDLAQQGLTVPSPNVSIPLFPADDPFGHALFGIYLNPKFDTLPHEADKPAPLVKAKSLVQAALNALIAPRTQGSTGFFTVTLTWNGSGDVDLHVSEPTGAHVFYQNKQGSSGFLDVDNIVADGPEHYFATCDPTRLVIGTYQIGINNFARATGRKATVQVATAATGEIFTNPLPLDVGPERGRTGDNSPIPVVKVIVSKDAQGNFKAITQ